MNTQLQRDTCKKMLEIGDTCVLLLIMLYNNVANNANNANNKKGSTLEITIVKHLFS